MTPRTTNNTSLRALVFAVEENRGKKRIITPTVNGSFVIVKNCDSSNAHRSRHLIVRGRIIGNFQLGRALYYMCRHFLHKRRAS